MPFGDPISNVGDSFGDADRRQCARQAPGSLSYVHLDENNGGILINLSENGLAVQAAMAVMEDDLPRLRLQMPRSKTWLETSARVAWTGDSRRTVGVQFLNSTEDFRRNLREWLAAEAATAAAAVEAFPSETAGHTANVEEIPLRTVRSSPQSHPLAVDASHFDLPALLTSRDMSGVAVARSMKLPADHARAVPSIATAAKESVPATSETPEKPSARRSGTYVFLMIVLAALSVVAGWEAARGNVFQTMHALFLPSSLTATTNTRSPRPAIPNALATNFEVIDSNNQAWLVPFSGPASAPAGPALPALPPKAAASLNEPPATPAGAFQTSNLAAPRPSVRASAAVGTAAPLVATPQSGALAATIAGPGPNFSLAPPPQPSATTPTPEVRSSLVEPNLIRSVQPVYPTIALNEHVEGAVTVHARIEADGSMSGVRALNGPGLLASAAVNAVRQWKYKPEMLDGRPVASDITVTVQFTAPH